MSGGSTPVAGGYMRQRYSQGYSSSGDDLEDDACSRPHPLSPSIPRANTWVEVLVNVLWIASALFIIYYGDQHSNFVYILWHDERIRRLPLYLGMVCVVLNVAFFLYTSMLVCSVRRFDEKWESFSISALPYVTLLGVIPFFLLSFALWPIWSFLTLPLLFTLFMASMVIFPHSMIGTLRLQNDAYRID